MYPNRHFIAFTTVALLTLGGTFIFLTQTLLAHASAESPAINSAMVQGPEPIALIKNLLIGGTERTQASLNEIKLTRAAGGDETVSADTRLFPGDELTTGPNAQLTILFLDEAAEKSNEVLVDSNSRVRVGSIFTWLGKVLIRCRGAFDARSEKVRLGVQGTEFELLVEPDGTNKVTVLEGAVSVENLLSASSVRSPEEWSSNSRPLFLKASYLDFLQQPKPISLVAVTGQVARLENLFTFTNRCGQRHHYEIAAPRTLGWFRFLNAEGFDLTARETRSLVFNVELDTRQVATGKYDGEIVARCLDCHLEPNCDVGGILLPVSINVIPRGAESVGTPGTSPTPDRRGTPGPKSVIARPRQEVVVDENGLRPPVNASDQELAASVNWSNSVILAGQPSYPAQSVVPHFSSWSARDQQFREARLNAVLRDDPRAYETLGDVYTDWGNGAKAADAYRRVRVPASQLTAEDLADRAEALRLAGNLDEAENLLKRAVSLNPEPPSALNTIGNVFRDRARIARDRREYKLADAFLNRARIAYDRALKAAPPSGGVPTPGTRRSTKDLSVVSATNVGEVLFEQGELARDLGQNDEALRQYLMAEGAFRRATEIDAGYSLARNGLGDTLHAAGEAARSKGDQAQANAFFRDASTEYNRALTLNRDMAEAQVGLGNVALSQGQKSEAIKRYTRAAQLRPEQPEPHYRLATTLVDVNPRLAAEYAATFLKLERRVFRTGERARIAEGIKSERITSNPSPSPTFPPSPFPSPRVSPSPPVTPTPTPTPYGPPIKIPGLKGDKPEKARNELEKLGFQVLFKEQPDCDGSGKVVSSDPPKDARVPRGSMVTVYVSSFGENPERVPDLNGSLMRDAEQMLREVGLTMKVTRREETDRAPRNTVIRQKPDSGRPFKRGCQVEVSIAIPIPPVIVRDFVGMNVNQAEQAISFSGLSMGDVSEVESRQTGGTVIDQEPRAGATVPRGTRVNLTISRIEWVEVPNVVGHSYGGAVEILSGYGLNHRVMSGDTKNDVVRQDPTSGRRVPRGTTVKLWFSPRQPGEN